LNGFIKSLFFGNYFYGICVVALSIEASLQQHVPLNSSLYYLFVFTATVLYYTHAYISEEITVSGNKRANWYYEHKSTIIQSQIFFSLVLGITAIVLYIRVGANLNQLTWFQWCLLGFFPLVAILYYGGLIPGKTKNNLRNQGWLKPFAIGFVWAGAVTVYPVLAKSIEDKTPYSPGYTQALLFLKNFMFITMLCIMFDIKDYASDHNKRLKTFVVQFGLRKTIFYVLIPLSSIGLGTFVLFAILRDFPLFRILVNTIPFLLLITVAYSLHQRKSILYYLAIIDGLMLAKSVCGIIGMTFIN